MALRLLAAARRWAIVYLDRHIGTACWSMRLSPALPAHQRFHLRQPVNIWQQSAALATGTALLSGHFSGITRFAGVVTQFGFLRVKRWCAPIACT